MACHFYILFSEAKNRFYTGATCDDLDERVRKHNSNHKKGFTGSAHDWVLVYTEAFDSKQEAFSREAQVKAWKSRKKIVELINLKD
jgi:putative endonuclease